MPNNRTDGKMSALHEGYYFESGGGVVSQEKIEELPLKWPMASRQEIVNIACTRYSNHWDNCKVLQKII